MRTALAISVLLGACVHHVAPALPFEEKDARLHVTLTISDSGPVQVHLQLAARYWPGDARPLFPLMPDSYNRKLQSRLALTTPPGADLDVSYSVEVPDVEHPLADVPVIQGSFDSFSGRFLALNTLLPELARDADHVLNTVPALVEIHSTLPFVTSLPGSDTTYWATSLEELHLGVVVVGNEVFQKTSKDGVRFLSTDYDEETLQTFASLEHRADELLTRSHVPRELLTTFVVHKRPKHTEKTSVEGIHRGQVAVMFSTDLPSDRATSRSGNIMIHELVHAYQPPDAALPHWIVEGFTEYFAHRLGITLDRLPEQVLYDDLGRISRAFSASSPSRRASEDNVGDYFGGAVLAYCIDVRLRRDHSSLEEVLADTRRKSKGAVANDQWEQTIAVASAAAGALVLSARTDPIDPVEKCFEEAGLMHKQGHRAVTDGYLVKELGITAFDAEPRHLDAVVRGVNPGSEFLDGDVIVSVAGNRVTCAAELSERIYEAFQIADAPDVRVTFYRNGQMNSTRRNLTPLRPDDSRTMARSIWLPR